MSVATVSNQVSDLSFDRQVIGNIISNPGASLLLEDVRAQVIDALVNQKFNTWIDLNTDPVGDRYFITRLGFETIHPIPNHTIDRFQSFLETGTLPVKYFNYREQHDAAGRVQVSGHNSPLNPNRTYSSLIAIEGRIAESQDSGGTVLTLPFVYRFADNAKITIKDITRIGICKPAAGSRVEEHFQTLLRALNISKD